MSKLKLRNPFKTKKAFGRAKSTTDLTEWAKSDEKLMKSVENGDIKKVTALLAKKSLVLTKLGPQGLSIFHVACALGHEKIVDLLCTDIDEVNDLTIQGNSALQLAAAKGHTAAVGRLLMASADVDLRDSNDMTALHHACAGQHLSCVRALLEGRANPHLAEKGGKTPLFYSAHRGQDVICRLLLDKGAEVNCQDMLSVTPVMIAAKEGHRNVCEFLLRRGANPELKDREGHTALSYAVAAGRTDLTDVFDRPPVGTAFAELPVDVPDSHLDYTMDFNPRRSPRSPHTDRSDAGSRFSVDTQDTLEPSVSQMDTRSRMSVDDRLLCNSPQVVSDRTTDVTADVSDDFTASASSPLRTNRAYKELEDEHRQLNEDYTTLARENLRLRDKVEAATSRLEVKATQGEETTPKEVMQEISSLKLKLQEEREKVKYLEDKEQTLKKQTAADFGNPALLTHCRSASGSTWPSASSAETIGDSQGKTVLEEDDWEVVQRLRSNSESLRRENDTLKQQESQSVPTEDQEQTRESKLQFEVNQLHAQINELQEDSEKQRLADSVVQEELAAANAALLLKVASLETEVEVARAGPTDAQRLDALLEQSNNFEEGDFDGDGFVQGRDMTKEEFLTSQNTQLRAHCTLLSEELDKLRATFDAILKAGDNLQADYDQQAIIYLQSEKDQLNDEIDVLGREKGEVVKENDFLLTDNNALHDNLKKLVHELEKLQGNFQATQAENEDLRRSVGVASKVGEVARLLEERDGLQVECDDRGAMVERLQHDHDILLEEVQSLSEAVTTLTTERDQLTSDLEMVEHICQQHEVLQQDYTQLESDFGELLKEKETLEEGLEARDFGELLKEKEMLEERLVHHESQGSTFSKLPQATDFTEEDNTSLKEERDKVKEERDRLKEELGQMQEEYSRLQEKISELGEELSSLLEDNTKPSKAEDSGSINNNNNNLPGLPEDCARCEKQQEELMTVRKHVARLSKDLADLERRHQDTVTTYRTHLLSAVQGHMDPDVKDALYHIIELRSMEQFC